MLVQEVKSAAIFKLYTISTIAIDHSYRIITTP